MPFIKSSVSSFLENANVSNSLKKAKRNAKYELENNFIASASLGPVNSIGVSFLSPELFNNSRKSIASLDDEPQIILEGFRLS
jgi:hypothetical protein